MSEMTQRPVERPEDMDQFFFSGGYVRAYLAGAGAREYLKRMGVSERAIDEVRDSIGQLQRSLKGAHRQRGRGIAKVGVVS